MWCPRRAPSSAPTKLAQQAELRAARDLAARRVERLKELADTVPRKDIEAAESELQSLTQRLGAVGAGLATRDALVAPVSGVIASANAVAGQVVDARELVFEVVDPSRLRIEALAYDPAQAQSVAGATLAVGGQRVPLRFVGAARSLRGQAQPLVFAGDSSVRAPVATGAGPAGARVGVQQHRVAMACRCPRRRCSAMRPTRTSSGSSNRPSALRHAWLPPSRWMAPRWPSPPA
jgi:cobalt-zinc-cadmium efflux system membrane fusion protein